mmetsp:Transcript_16121/g.22628  ORF Transcript_16121/g.22628 Transcript_16121/m.22628 type:complete len:389 (+) Transcript_16121:30-1196(+)
MEQNVQVARERNVQVAREGIDLQLSSKEERKKGKNNIAGIRASCDCSDNSSFVLVAAPIPSEAKGDEWVKVENKTHKDEEEADGELANQNRRKEVFISYQENRGERESRIYEYEERVNNTSTPPNFIPSYFETPTDSWDERKNEMESEIDWESDASDLNFEEKKKDEKEKIATGSYGGDRLIPPTKQINYSDSNQGEQKNDDLRKFQNVLFLRNFKIHQIKADKEAAELIQKNIYEELVINYQANEYCAFGDYSPFSFGEYGQNENILKSQLDRKSLESEFRVDLPFHINDEKGKTDMKSNPKIRNSWKSNDIAIISKEPRSLRHESDVTNLALPINGDEARDFDELELDASELEAILHGTLKHFKDLRDMLKYGLDQLNECVQARAD